MAIFKQRIVGIGQFLRRTDHGNIGYIGTRLFAGNGTDNTNVYNDMYYSDNRGRNWSAAFTPAWSARNAACQASTNNKFYLWSGSNYTQAFADSYILNADGTSSQISASMTGYGDRTSAASCVIDGEFYTAGGMTFAGAPVTTVIKSTDLITWTDVTTLPVALQDGILSMCVLGGVVYMVTCKNATTPGKLYKSTDKFLTYELVLESDIFRGGWANIDTTGDALVFYPGYVDALGGNLKGSYYWEVGTDITDEANWKRTMYELPPTHATPTVGTPWGGVYTHCGNLHNTTGEFIQIDKV